MTIRFVVALVLVVIVCGGLVAFNVMRDQGMAAFFASMPVPVQTVSATEVRAVTWQPGIEAIGTAKASQGVDVAVEAPGVVRSIHFTANQRIEAGQLLVQLDDSVERADLIAAQAAAERDRAQLARAQSLEQRGAGTQAALDEAQAAVAASRSALERLAAVIDEKSVEAPFAGMIGIPQVDVGEYVQPGQVIATLQDFDTMKVDFTVPEQEVENLGIGQTARFGADVGELTLTGRITGIEPKIDPATRLISVQAELDNPEGTILPGQFVRVRLDLPPEEGVIAVPQTAVTTSLYGDYVFLVEPAPPAEGQPPPQEGAEPALVARQVFVETGRRNGGFIEIASGLAPGAMVVTSGQNKLDAGTPVRIDNTVDPTALAMAAEN